jgi:hypothetical protein
MSHHEGTTFHMKLSLRSSIPFEALSFHHMAPMTGGIAYTQKNRLIFLLSFLESFFSPCIPIYRIVSMLK